MTDRRHWVGVFRRTTHGVGRLDAGEETIQRRSQRVDVCPGVRALPLNLLERRVVRRVAEDTLTLLAAADSRL